VTSHQEGERTFHILYQLISGASKSQRKAFGLDEYQKPEHFRILCPTPTNNTNAASRGGGGKTKPASPKGSDKNRPTATINKNDSPDFERTCQALRDVGVTGSALESLLGVVAGLLHLGDAVYHDETR
jgi:myosin heavy subunit